MRAAGAVIIGTTSMPELAIWPFTEGDGWVTRNPIVAGPGKDDLLLDIAAQLETLSEWSR